MLDAKHAKHFLEQTTTPEDIIIYLKLPKLRDPFESVVVEYFAKGLIEGQFFRTDPYSDDLAVQDSDIVLPIMMLQHPIYRIARLYQYYSRNVKERFHSVIHQHNLSLIDFVTYPTFTGLNHNIQTALLTKDISIEEDDDTQLELAKKKLNRLAYFGIDSEFERSVQLFNYTFDVHLPDIPAPAFPPLTSEEIDAIEELVSLDLALFNYAKLIFDLNTEILSAAASYTPPTHPEPSDHYPHAPRATYVICGLPRSGSSLLTSILNELELAGYPDEHFYVENETQQAKEWGILGEDFETYLRELIKQTSRPDGFFSFKLIAYHLDRLIINLRTMPSTPQGMTNAKDLLDYYFPNAKFIYIYREDKIRQAISYLKALQTQIWSSHDAKHKTPAQDPYFDYEELEKCVQEIYDLEKQWDDFFSTYDIHPLILSYETLAQQLAKTVKEVLKFIEYPNADSIEIPEPAIKKQANQLSDEWYQRYLDKS